MLLHRALPLLALLLSATGGWKAEAWGEKSPCEKEVIIIGAGFSGLAAGKTLKDYDLHDFVILESTERVGGRVKSNTFGSKNVTIEECANWVYPRNPIFKLIKRYGLNRTLSDFFNTDMYEYNETAEFGDANYDAEQIPDTEVADRLEVFRRDALDCLTDAAAEFFNSCEFLEAGADEFISSLEYLEKECNWTIMDNQDWYNFWLYVNFEFAGRVGDTTFAEVFDPYFDFDSYLMVDQGGYDSAARMFADENKLNSHILFGKRVTDIKYDLTGKFRARVKVDSTEAGGCEYYYANRIILTVPAGVLNNNLITFDPELLYNDAEYNPLKVGDYIKVFYEFEEDFWSGTLDKQYLVSLQEEDNVGKCHHWQNLEATAGELKQGTSTEFLPGSNILFCTIVDGTFNILLDESGTDELTEDQLTGELLEPLRRVFPDVNVTSKLLNYYYPKQNLNQDYGFGSYSNWRPGFSIKNYTKFYGIGPQVGTCDHNGCNIFPGEPGFREHAEWVLHLSGTGSCYEEWEFVHGAYLGGERSANFVLKDLGYIDRVPNSRCDVSFPKKPKKPKKLGKKGKANGRRGRRRM